MKLHKQHNLVSAAAAGAVLLAAGLLNPAPAEATATATATGTATMEVVQIRDAAGAPIPAPAGLAVNHFVGAPAEGPDAAETGTGAVVYGGTATTSGMGETAQVAISSSVVATASPSGSAEGIETVSGTIQFINNSGQTLSIDVDFDWAVNASSSVMDTALETAQVVIADVELQESLGGSPTSPCTGGLFVDAELNAVSAPPDASSAIGPSSTSRTVLLPDGETCSFTSLAQMVAEAQAQPEPVPMPSLPGAMAVVLLLALMGAGWWRLSRRPAGA